MNPFAALRDALVLAARLGREAVSPVTSAARPGIPVGMPGTQRRSAGEWELGRTARRPA